ncbi:hypothetical protein VTO73DRAFT_4608 [Trametes versicolor]
MFPEPRTMSFLALLDGSPGIRPFVRSLVFSMSQHPYTHYSGGTHPYAHHSSGTSQLSWRAVVDRLPSLRSLRFREFRLDCLHDLVSVAGDRPTLEALYLESVMIERASRGMWPPPQPAQLPGTSMGDAYGRQPTPWGLRTLSVVNAIVPCSELEQLALFLERATEASYLSLDTLDLHWPFHGSHAYEHPGLCVRAEVPSFGATLRHLGVTLSDLDRSQQIVPDGRAHMQRVMTAISACSSLRSLCLRYDRWSHLLQFDHDTPPDYTPTPFFLDLLADTLSGRVGAPGVALIPLEDIALYFKSPPHWLIGFETAFDRLAEALVGDVDESAPAGRRRYPRFAHLDVRMEHLNMLSSVLRGSEDIEEHRARQMVGKDLIHPMLERFARAGVHVEVVCE